MKLLNISNFSILFLLCLFLLPVISGIAVGKDEEAISLYVSRDTGNNEWSGRLKSPNSDRTDGPFATIRKAKSTIRTLKKKKDGLSRTVTVYVRNGRYALREPLVLTPEDSGSSTHRITYSAYPGESPVISGGRRLGDWQKTEGNLWKMKLDRVAEGEWSFRQLWINGKRRQRARMPNDGYYEFRKMVRPDNPKAEVNRRAFVFKEGQIKADWTNLQDVEILKFFGFNESRRTIRKVDTKNNVCYLAGPMTTWEKRPMNWFGKRFLVENVREGLDQPGEWYLNKQTGVLWYHPTENERSTESVTTVAPVLNNLITFRGTPGKKRVKNITIEGFTLQYSGASFPDTGYNIHQSDPFVPGVIEGRGTRDIRLSQNEIVHVGTDGVDFRADNRRLAIVGNEMHDLGGGGIQIGETGEPKNRSQETTHNRVTDNEIHHGGKIYLVGAGIWVGQSAYNTIAHNEVNHIPGMAVSVGWTWRDKLTSCHHNKIRFNHIHDIGLRLIGSASGIYLLSRQPGTEAHHNLIHHLSRYTAGMTDPGFEPSHATFGFQLDNGFSQGTIHHNVVHHVPDAAYKQMGTDHKVYNNVFAYAKLGDGFEILRRSDQGALFFHQNIVLSKTQHLIGGHWDKRNARMDYNLYWSSDGPPRFDGGSLKNWRKTGRDRNSVVKRPDFAPIKRGDRVFDPGSVGKRIGFETIDLRSVGPREPDRQP